MSELIVTDAGTVLIADSGGERSPTREELTAAYLDLAGRFQTAERTVAAAEAVASEISARCRKWTPETGSLPFPLATSIDRLERIFVTS